MPPSKVKVVNPTPEITSATKRNHPCFRHGYTARRSFVLVCSFCGWESATCYDREDEVQAIRRHWLDVEIHDTVALRVQREPRLAQKREDYHASGRNARRRATKKARRSEDGETQVEEGQGATKAEAGFGEAVRGGEEVRGAVRSPKPGRRGSGGWT